MAITIWFGLMRNGKSFCVTDEVINNLIEGKRAQYTNWPVVIRLADGRVLSSRVWRAEYVQKCIVDSDIYVDESYRDYDCHDPKKYEISGAHTFHATCGHNNNEINLIAHTPARIVQAAREITINFIWVKKTSWPIVLWVPFVLLSNWLRKTSLPLWAPYPLYFTKYSFASEADISKNDKSLCHAVHRVWFNQRTANAYNTHYFRDEMVMPFVGPSWLEDLKIQPAVLKPVPSTKERFKGVISAMSTRLNCLCVRLKSDLMHWGTKAITLFFALP
jgi:hypothetical protein